MFDTIASELSSTAGRIEDHLEKWTKNLKVESSGEKKLVDAISYSLLGGGKRFRPALAIWVGEAFQANEAHIMTFAMGVEMVHTYSLIHDDLPCMDNDDTRRGKPTNHIVFGEDFALLAGDALLTAAFQEILENCGPNSAAAALELSRCSGLRGMVGGQAMDLFGQKSELSFAELRSMHLKKTGDLIVASVVGAGRIVGLGEQKLESMGEFARHLGHAFQIADDILDFSDERQDLENLVHHVGLERAREELCEASKKAEKALQSAECSCVKLHKIIEFNLHREH